MRNLSKAMLFNDGMQMLEIQEQMRYCLVANSSALITDAEAAAAATYSAAAKAAATAAAGPIMDLNGTVSLLVTKLQEMKEILAYLLEGTQVPSNLSAPTGGPITTGNDNVAWGKLVGIYQILA